MKGAVSRVTGEKVLKAFLLEPRVVSTGEAVVVTRLAPGEALHVGESGMALRPPVPAELEITNKHTDTQTHTQNTAINIIDPVTQLTTCAPHNIM